MKSLFRKELYSFFGSIIGYLVIAIFMLVTGLFLWVISGGFNIIDGERATLSGLFDLAPWVYLFLIPAITMRMFAEEKRTGTIELLITRPIKTFQIVAAKYLASLLLVFISLLPVVFYYITVYMLGTPVGNIDTGATVGSLIGLFLLASIYIAIGLFASSLTSNQVVSFLLAIAMCYIFYLGFEFAAFSGLPNTLQYVLLQMGINQHYLSISRGVVDSRDVFYFVIVTFLFLKITQWRVASRKKKWRMKPLFVIALVAAFVASGFLVSSRIFRIDLTSEKRYSLSKATRQILKQQKKPIGIEIYLTGDLPSEMQEFQKAIIEKIEDFNAWSNVRISYHTFDIYSIEDSKERDKFISDLTEAGIEPVNFNHKTTEGLSTKMIFPGAFVQSDGRGVGLDLLKRDPILSGEEKLKESMELLEYELTRAVLLLQQKEKPIVAFLAGQGEASAYETGDIRYSLSDRYKVEDITGEQLLSDNSVKILVIADPKTAFSERDKLGIDQFIMKGGKVLWCIDPVFCSIDSLSRGYSTVAFSPDLRINDQLFKYGVRMNPDLVQDVVCAQYPVNTAPAGQPSQFTPAPFYFSPLATPSSKHPLSRNLSHVFTEFVSSIEIVGKSQERTAAPILTTSPYAHKISTPAPVSLAIATVPPDKRLFNQSEIPIGVLVEGKFESIFANRITDNLGMATNTVRSSSKPTKMVFIADGGLIENKVRMQNGKAQILPLGYDPFSQQTFGNKEFITNCIDYLADESGIVSLRTRVVKLRILDKVKIREHLLGIQLLNVAVPALLLALAGLIFQFIRKRKFIK